MRLRGRSVLRLRLRLRQAGLPVRLTPPAEAAPGSARPSSRRGSGVAALVYLVLTLGLLLSCTPLTLQTSPLGINYVAVSPTIGTAGAPRHDQLEAVAAAGYRTVINLAPPGALGTLADESDAVARLGLHYANVPVDFSRPTAEDYVRFAALMRTHADERVFVHCQINLRASSFVFLYRVLELGDDPDRAYDDVLRVWQPAPQWRSFIRVMLEQRKAPLPLALEA
jgi:protein tyrosine phosphatase (PTP) superfamily phosphohydrolase (DUF442 family)